MKKSKLIAAATWIVACLVLLGGNADAERAVRIKKISDLNHESGKLGEYKALIIGINDYKGPEIPDLETAINDAKTLAKVLKEKYGFKVNLLLDREATREAIYRGLRRLAASTEPNDSVLIYFAGHGDLDRTYDDGWWIPADAKGGDPLTYLDNVQVQKAMRSMKARHVLLISDSCYSGTLFGKARSLPPVIDDRYYLSLYNEKSRWGMTSGNKTPVSDQGTGGHSVFAYQLIKELERNDKPFLSTQEIYTRIAPIIANNSEQTPLCRPIVNTGDQGGEFVFVASVKKAPPQAAPSTQKSLIDKETVFWQSIQDRDDPALFEAYLKTFPNGVFVSIAKLKIEILKQKQVVASIPPKVLKSKLFVETEPRDASVRILNIRPAFHQGMEFDPGDYHVEVSRDGHETERSWVSLKAGEDKRVDIRLKQLRAPIQTKPSNLRPSSLSPDIVERDGVYRAYANGIVLDTSTGLEWFAGPDKDMNWDKAKAWVQRLKIDGGGWRLPSRSEVKTLYKKGAGTRNITPLLKTTGWRIWSDEPKDSLWVWLFHLYHGKEITNDRNVSSPNRVFAVRSRIDSQSQKVEVSSIQETSKDLLPSSTKNVVEQDGVYVAYANGIVKDTKTGLEWKVGPDKDTTWDEARSWVQSLNLDSGGWRMPTMDELEGLYNKGAGDRNMTSLLKTTGWRVWSGETEGSSVARGFDFGYGSRTWDDRNLSGGIRAFAVRSRSDG